MRSLLEREDDLADLDRALGRAREKSQSRNVVRLHEQLLSLLQGGQATSAPTPVTPPKYLDRIAVQMHGKVRVVRVAQIEYITASGPYVDLHVGNQRFAIRESMQNLADKLDPEIFLRIHRSYIVNGARIRRVKPLQKGEYAIFLEGNAVLDSGRTYRHVIERFLEQRG